MLLCRGAQNFYLGGQKMTYDLLKTALDVTALRQEAISSNISNINTPDYKANRVEFEKYFENAINGHSLNKTHANHLDIHSKGPMVTKQESTSVQDNGNNVDIDYEMAELSANNVRYDAVVSQLNAKYTMMRSVMK